MQNPCLPTSITSWFTKIHSEFFVFQKTSKLVFITLLAICISAAAASDPDDACELKPSPQPKWFDDYARFAFLNIFDDKLFDVAVRDGVNIICGGTNASGSTFAGGPFGWDGKDRFDFVYADYPGLTFSQIVARVEKAHALKLKVVGELLRMWDPQQMKDHPDWQQLPTADAQPKIPGNTYDTQINGCWYSPYGDFYIRKNVELVKRLHWDGQNLDGFGTYGVCYCSHCKEGYRKSAGADIPSIIDVANPNCRRYLRWRLDAWNKYVYRWMKALKEVNPDFAFFPWSASPGRWIHLGLLPQSEGADLANMLVDAPMVELFWDFANNPAGNLFPSFTIRQYRGICQERKVWFLPYMRNHGQTLAVTPLVEAEFRWFTVLANGGLPALPYWGHNTSTQPKHFMDLFKQVEPYIKEAKSKKWAAMVVSDNSRMFYGVSSLRGELTSGKFVGSGVDTQTAQQSLPFAQWRMPAHIESALGLFRAATEEHLPLDIITDIDLEQGTRLNEYRVLLMPNAGCLSEKALDNIHKFVHAGGGLVALHETSICDQIGDRQKDFGLADLFNVSFLGTENHSKFWPDSGAPNSVALRMKKHFITDDPVCHAEDSGLEYESYGGVDYIGWMTNIQLKRDAQVVAEWKDPKSGKYNPLLVLSDKGQGRVAYFATDIGQAYFVSPYQYERRLIANTIRWVANKTAPIHVAVPMCVKATYYEQKIENRVVVHLLNEINSNGGGTMAVGDCPMRDEVVPVRDIKVSFKDAKIKSATLQPEGLKLDVRRTSDGVEVTVPELKLYAMVVAELEK